MGKLRANLAWLVATLLVTGAAILPSAAGANEKTGSDARKTSSDARLSIDGPIWSAIGELLQRRPSMAMLELSSNISISGTEQPDAQFGCTILDGAAVVEEPAADVIVIWEDDGVEHVFVGSTVTLGVCTTNGPGETFDGVVEGTLDGEFAVAQFSWDIPPGNSGEPTGSFSVGTFSYADQVWEGCAKVVPDANTPTCGAGGGGGGGPTTTEGRMTGGGSFGDPAVTHGFTLHCDPAARPNNLSFNWGDNSFKLDSLDTVTCSDEDGYDEGAPEAGFDTLTGTGTGTLNGESGATAEWKFTDKGEPGNQSTAAVTITSGGDQVLVVPETELSGGNHQAHPGEKGGSSKQTKPARSLSIGLAKAYVF